jgi:hypothetical protein
VSLAEALELTLLLAEGEPETYDKTGSRPPGSLRRGVDADVVQPLLADVTSCLYGLLRAAGRSSGAVGGGRRERDPSVDPPDGELSAPAVPPWASAIVHTIESPSPRRRARAQCPRE